VVSVLVSWFRAPRRSVPRDTFRDSLFTNSRLLVPIMSKKQRKIDKVSSVRVRQLLDYSPGTGEFRWAVGSPSRRVPGSIAGSKTGGKRKELTIVIDGVACRACLLAFLWMEKDLPRYVRYADGDKSNISWSNLVGSETLARVCASRAVGIKSIFSVCPLIPGAGTGTGPVLTKFNTEAAFFRACCGKQEQIRMCGNSRINGGLVRKLNSQCHDCEQAKGSRKKELVIDLKDIRVGIDPGMGVER